MQPSHSPAAVCAAFDDPKVKLTGARNGAGAAADAKVTSIVGGMVAGAESIDDLDMLRHGAMPTVSLSTPLHGPTPGPRPSTGLPEPLPPGGQRCCSPRA